MAQAKPDTEQLVRDYGEMWNEQEFAKIPDLVSESVVVSHPSMPDGEVRGHEGLEEWMHEVTTGFPNIQVEIIDLLASDETVMVEVNYTMTHEGEFNEIPATGREVNMKGMSKFAIEDGEIKEHQEYIDRQESFEQLGLS
ncbi:hypothetical protein GS429_06990 [Natronorubrum sp. JWXQ-INN-674]|uniref:Ester cyclase n=1 Tax=Natronorubrum halalkaliphilum TaxID=2691917 RepID=A0A6B0VJU7_9EURY|nr:ester cyclase [Natronorubrum halalkaliphilum]MXV61814.1 hypothetical protein [Natronorubrum halalkaliphilum]